MILEILFNLVFGILDGALNLIPQIPISYPAEHINTFISLVESAYNIVPMNTILTILALNFAIVNFRIIYNIFLKVWSMLPFT